MKRPVAAERTQSTQQRNLTDQSAAYVTPTGAAEIRRAWVRRGRKFLVASAALTTLNGAAVANFAPAHAYPPGHPGSSQPAPEPDPDPDPEPSRSPGHSDSDNDNRPTNQNGNTDDNPDPGHSYDEVGTNVWSPDVTTITGTDGDDVITVSDNDYNREITRNGQTFIAHREPGRGVTIDSGDGNDTITGTEFDDTIFSGNGNDTVHARGGNDVVDLGGGNDVAFGGEGHDQIFGRNGDDELHGEGGNDFLSAGSGDDVGSGGDGEDVIYGHDGNDNVFGGDGTDYLSGGPGEDKLMGEGGNDSLSGGLGDDELDGGEGNDVNVGGPGVDRIVDTKGDVDKVYADDDDLLRDGTGDEVVRINADLELLEFITVQGPDQDGVSQINADLVTLASLPGGQTLLRNLNRNGQDLTIRQTNLPAELANVIPNHPPTGDSDGPPPGFLRPDGSRGSGTSSFITIGTGASRFPGHNNGHYPVATVPHELLHVDQMYNGMMDPGRSVELDQFGQPLVNPRTGERVVTNDLELQAVGLPYDRDGNQESGTDGFEETTNPEDLEENVAPITENSIRGELGLPARQNYDDGENVLSMEEIFGPPPDFSSSDFGGDIDSPDPGVETGHSYDEVGTGAPNWENQASSDAAVDQVTDFDSTSNNSVAVASSDDNDWSRPVNNPRPSYPQCQGQAPHDPDGDGLGLEDGEVCLADTTFATTTTDTPSPEAPLTETDSEPAERYQPPVPTEPAQCVDEGSDDRLNWGVNLETNEGCWVNGTPTKQDCVEHGQQWECPDGNRYDFDVT